MKPQFPKDPELQNPLRIRSFAGVAVLLAVSAGISAIPATSPTVPAPSAVSCAEPGVSRVFDDAAPDRAGCAPAAPRATRPAAGPAATWTGMPPPAADARADDPPIATF